MQAGLRSRGLKFLGATALGILTLATFAAGEAQATEGYFQYGYGARQGGLGGAGVADSRDAMALSLNPAGIVDVGRQFQIGVSLFAPYRDYTATGTFFVAPGSYSSKDNLFPVPNIAYSQPIDADSAWGVAMYGNGGMNTNWTGIPNTSLGCVFGAPPVGVVKPGVFCGGSAGVDMMQAFIAAGYARRMGPLSFGISPTFVIQRFRGDGLAMFAPFSSNPGSLTGNGYSYSYGGGLRAGLQWSIAPNVRIGIAGSTPMWMTKFDKYSGLFANGGDFDIPANVTAGVAFDAMPNLTFMVDYKHIFYSSIQSVGNSSAITGIGVLGLDGGPGFGWHDVDVIKVGAEWRATPTWTLRVGYAHNTNPIKSTDVTFNILAPGVVTDHFTGGFAYQMSRNSTIEFAAAVIPTHSVSGPEALPPGFPPVPPGNIEISMHQYQFTLGYTYKFDAPPAPMTGLIHK